MKYLSLSIPNPNIKEPGLQIQTPPGVPDMGFVSGMSVLQAIFTGIFVIAAIVALAMIIYSGIQWIVSGGEPKAIQGARNRLVYSIIGLIVIVTSFAVVSAVISLAGGDPSFFLPQ